ncbi:sensor domain-containing protein [Psychromonas aquimarina]|uniref:sensor domain-containing protein n=1 Tax=Psychromonas aquimarina TaxID=444919 RepID=UPI00041EE72F|nr:EAL domain-containing protein [Psychromonas aquimarina]
MSVGIENVLYIGKNIKLVEVMLDMFKEVSAKSECQIQHLTSSAEIHSALAAKNYQYLLCEQEMDKAAADKIASDYPLLKTFYLAGLQDVYQAAEKSRSDSVIKVLLTDEVKATLDCIRIPIYYKNKQGEFLACNSYFAQAVGMTSGQIIGKTAAEILPPHLLPGLEQVDQKVFEDNQVHLYECEYVDAAGIHREVVFRKEAIEGGEIQVGTILDMSELNNAKRLIEKERVRLRATADLSSDLIFFKDLESRFLGCNKEFERFVGCPERDILGKRDDQLFELDQALMCQAQDQDVMTTKQIHHGKEYLTYKDGVRHFIEMKKVPLQDKDGKVQGLIGMGRDITAQYMMQKRFKVANVVFENSKDSIIVTDERGDIISANESSCRVSGYSRTELLQANINIFSSEQHDQLFYEQIEDALQLNNNWQGDITYRIKNGDTYYAWLEIYVVEHPGEGGENRVYSFTDLSQCKKVEEKTQFLSKHDPLTGLFNRIALFTRLEDAIARSSHKEIAMAVVLVDINGFKTINDQYGHNAGDRVLKEIARRLKSCVFEKDTVARFGDDEFVLLIDELTNEQGAAIVAQKIARQFSSVFLIDNAAVKLSATIGISIFPDDGVDVDTLLSNAEKAMQRAKYDKSAPYHFYTVELTRYSNQQFALEDELKNALHKQQFELYYQPQYDLNKRQIVALESLLRWKHPQHGLLLPDSFLILVEESGLLVPIGLQMIRKAAEQAVIWSKSGINFGRIAINLSEIQLEQLSFIADIQTILKDTGCSNRWLEFEIGESVFSSDSVNIHENLLNLSKVGFALTVDGFGADRSVLYSIDHLRIEKFKISKQFIHGVPGHLAGEAMIKSVIVLARALGIDVVGEGIESAEQEAFLTAQNIDSGQGHFEAKPMKTSEMTFYLRCNKRK